MTSSQPKNCWLRKDIEQGQHGVPQVCSQILQTSKPHVAFRLAQEHCVESFIERVSMAELYISKHNAKNAEV